MTQSEYLQGIMKKIAAMGYKKQTKNKPNRLPLCSECLILWSLANIKFRIKGVVK